MKLLFVVGGVLCLLAAGAMYLVGCTDPKLTELKATFWLPIPPGSNSVGFRYPKFGLNPVIIGF